MTDKPTTAPTENAAPADQTLQFRRILVWVIALVLALLTSFAILQFGVSLIWPNNGSIPLNETFPLSFVNVPLLPLMMIPMTLFWVIWVDHFMNARVVND